MPALQTVQIVGDLQAKQRRRLNTALQHLAEEPAPYRHRNKCNPATQAAGVQHFPAAPEVSGVSQRLASSPSATARAVKLAAARPSLPAASPTPP